MSFVAWTWGYYLGLTIKPIRFRALHLNIIQNFDKARDCLYSNRLSGGIHVLKRVVLASFIFVFSALPFAHSQGAAKDPKAQLESMKIPFTEASFVAEAEKGNLQAVNLFLAAKMSVEAKDEEGRTPLISACNTGRKDVVQLLLSKGADVKASDNDDSTPLIAAARSNYIEIVNMLLDKGAVIDASDDDDATPLMYAAQNGHTEMVKLLLDRGADAFLTNDDDETAQMIAKSNKHQDIVDLLSKAKPKPHSQTEDDDDDDD
jgi:uncharacterized protein